MFIGENQDEGIGFVFASHKKWSLEAHELYESMKADPETPPEVGCRMGAVAFADMEQFIPLQAADHLAFESYHYMNDPRGTHRPALNILMDWDQNHGSFYNEPTILDYIEKAKQEGIF